jgi:hypothetical protein
MTNIAVDLPLMPFDILSKGSNQLAQEFTEQTPIGALNSLWLVPVNFLSNLAGMILTPIASLVALIAAAIFASIAICSDDIDQMEEMDYLISDIIDNVIAACTVGEVVMLGRLFNPNACSGIEISESSQDKYEYIEVN